MLDFDLLRSKLPEHVAKPDPDRFMSDNWLSLDFETTVIDKGDAHNEKNDTVLACWEHADRKMSYAWGGCYEQPALVEAVEKADFLVAHNAKFELKWLQRMGVDISDKLVFDTMIGEYVLGGNQYAFSQLSLENSCQRRWNTGKDKLISTMYKAGVCSNEIPDWMLLKYCIKDVKLTTDLFLAQREELRKTKRLPVMYTRCLATPVLADIERNGMMLDPDGIVAYTEEKEAEYVRAEENMERLTDGINISSPPQLQAHIYDKLGFEEKKDRRGNPIRTAKGARKSDKDTVAALKAKTPEQREFLTAYKHQKALYNELTKYLRKFKECCEEDGGLLTAEFNQTGTRTHRLASNGKKYKTQFQNFPRAYKNKFKARNEGWLVGEGDGAQLEFRVAGHLGRDKQVRYDLDNNVDIHKFTASKLNNCTPEEVTGAQRQAAKADTFKPLYGGQSGSKAQVRYYEAFREKYSGVTAAQKQWINEVLMSKKLVTEWGLTYYWPDTKQDRSGYIKNTTSICNYPVQALATAEIIPVALVYFYHYIKAAGLQMFIVNTIHDSIICELPPEEEAVFHELCRQCLIHEAGGYLDTMYDIDFTIPLGCGVKAAPLWSEGEETVYED